MQSGKHVPISLKISSLLVRSATSSEQSERELCQIMRIACDAAGFTINSSFSSASCEDPKRLNRSLEHKFRKMPEAHNGKARPWVQGLGFKIYVLGFRGSGEVVTPVIPVLTTN